MKEATLKVEKSELKETSNEEQLKGYQTKAEIVFKELQDLQEKNSKKKYLVDGKKKTQEALERFLVEDAVWKSHEALGVIKAHEEVKEGLKKNELFLSGLCIEALAFYIDKHQGTGLKYAQEFKNNLFMPINEVYGKVQGDRQGVKAMQDSLGELEGKISHLETVISQGL